VGADDAAPTKPCQSDEFRQFDFWLGTWTLTWEGGTGTNVITKELGDCVIEENFTSHDSLPFMGHSVSTYSTRKGLWLQTWVDNAGGYLDFEGGRVADSMILSRSYVDTSGAEIGQRMIFFNIEDDSLDWHWQRSIDGGKTWTLSWAIHYERRLEAEE
jgi:hypothetical protein